MINTAITVFKSITSGFRYAFSYFWTNYVFFLLLYIATGVAYFIAPIAGMFASILLMFILLCSNSPIRRKQGALRRHIDGAGIEGDYKIYDPFLKYPVNILSYHSFVTNLMLALAPTFFFAGLFYSTGNGNHLSYSGSENPTFFEWFVFDIRY